MKPATETTPVAMTTEHVTTPKPFAPQLNPPRVPEYTTVVTVPAAPNAPGTPKNATSDSTPSTGEHVSMIPLLLLFASVGAGTGAIVLRKRKDDDV